MTGEEETRCPSRMSRPCAARMRRSIAAIFPVPSPPSIRRSSGRSLGGGPAPRGTFHGSESVGNDVFATVPANFDEFQVDPDQFIDAGDHVVVVGHFRGRAKSGQQFDAPFAHVWAMRTGKAVRFHNYVQADAWARAWGG